MSLRFKIFPASAPQFDVRRYYAVGKGRAELSQVQMILVRDVKASRRVALNIDSLFNCVETG